MDITDHKHAEQKLVHQVMVLRALKAIDMLVADEIDCCYLITYLTNLLVQAGNYTYVWMVLLDQDSRFRSLASSVQREEFAEFDKILEKGQFPPCFRDVQVSDKKYVIYHSLMHHAEFCPLARLGDIEAVFIARLEYAGCVCGFMGGSYFRSVGCR